jgi:hypothetical protein
VRVDLDEISLSLTPTDALCESGWPIDEKVGRDLEWSDLATRKENELGGDGDGRCAEAYGVIKV